MTVRGEKEVASHWLVVARLARAILVVAAADGWDAAKRRIGEVVMCRCRDDVCYIRIWSCNKQERGTVMRRIREAYRDDSLERSPDRDAARRYITEIAALVRHDAASGGAVPVSSSSAAPPSCPAPPERKTLPSPPVPPPRS